MLNPPFLSKHPIFVVLRAPESLILLLETKYSSESKSRIERLTTKLLIFALATTKVQEKRRPTVIEISIARGLIFKM